MLCEDAEVLAGLVNESLHEQGGALVLLALLQLVDDMLEGPYFDAVSDKVRVQPPLRPLGLHRLLRSDQRNQFALLSFKFDALAASQALSPGWFEEQVDFEGVLLLERAKSCFSFPLEVKHGLTLLLASLV